MSGEIAWHYRRVADAKPTRTRCWRISYRFTKIALARGLDIAG